MKKRIRRSDPEKQTYWEEVMRRWRGSGQSARAFCRAEGLRESAFYFWRRELARRSPQADVANGFRSETPARKPASRSPRRRSSRHGTLPSFVPLHVVEDSAGGATGGVEIVLMQGRTVRVQAGFDQQTLAEVLAVLEARPC